MGLLDESECPFKLFDGGKARIRGGAWEFHKDSAIAFRGVHHCLCE